MNKYQGRVDPLELLRTYIVQKKKIRQKDTYLYFDDIKLKLSTQTPWLSPITHKQYDLGSLWLLLDADINKLNSVSYIDKSSQIGVDIVSTSDKAEIIAYFQGKIPDSNCINNDLKLQIIQKQLKKEKDGEDQGPSKKLKIQTEADLNIQVMIWLKSFEKPIMSKTRAIRTPQKSYQDVIKALRTGGDQKEALKPGSKSKLSSIYERKKNPIIIVPDNSQPGNVCIKNIRNLLIDGSFVESAQLQDNPTRKIEISFPIKQKNVVFQITNNPSLLTPADWSCVIAIFVSGRHAQFNGWQQTNPSRIFQKHKGFYLKYPDSKAGEANDWNVKVINIQKMTRYQDIDVQKFIWGQIQKELLSSSNDSIAK